MSWQWLEPPDGFKEPRIFFDILEKLVALSGKPSDVRSRRQEFFHRVRDTVVAVKPETAREALAELADVRRRWTKDAFPGYHALFEAKIARPENEESLAEYTKHRQLLREAKPQFLALDADFLALAVAALERLTTGFPASAEDFAGRTSFAPTACDFLDERWPPFRPVCLLSRGSVARVPAAAVSGQVGEIQWLVCEVFPHGTGTCGPHPLQESRFGTKFETAVAYAWTQAWNLAGNLPVTGMWHFEASEQSATDVDGGSAGGTLARAFYRALKGEKADPRVLVIASISATGELGKVADADIPAKVRAACEHGEIDTIATVFGHCRDVANQLDAFYLGTPGDRRIRVVDIADPLASWQPPGGRRPISSQGA